MTAKAYIDHSHGTALITPKHGLKGFKTAAQAKAWAARNGYTIHWTGKMLS